MHDPKVYPDPFNFNPERYKLGKNNGSRAWDDETLSPDQTMNPDPRKFAFGYGRRFAETSAALYSPISYFFIPEYAPGCF